MITLIELYVKKLEQQLNKSNGEKETKLWDKIKLNKKILDYSISTKNNKFNSKLICIKILKDTTLFNTQIYIELSNKILSNIVLAQTLINNSNDTFLLLLLKNKDLKLNRKQKIFLINEANNLLYSSNYYKNKRKDIYFIHGSNLLDLRYQIITNKNFTLQEKKNLFNFFYPDNELKICVLEELEWELMKILKIDNYNDSDVEKIYEINDKDLENIFHDLKKQAKINHQILLCKYIKNSIPKEYIIKYKNNDY